MTRITIATKLRFAAAIAPIVLLIVTPLLAFGFYLFGAMPALLQDNQFGEMRASDGMEAAIYKLDWGRAQPDGMEIVKGQERRFVNWVDSARLHATTREQLDKIEEIAQTANPIFDTLRKNPSDDSIEPRLQDLQSKVADLSGANETAMADVVARAQSRSRIFIAIALIAGILVPWAAFLFAFQMAGVVGTDLREIRHRVERISEGEPAPGNLAKIDEKLTELGFPKPNPMLAE